MTRSRSEQASRTVRLRDGRRLAWQEYRAAGGKRILYFHGWPGSSLEAQLADEAAHELNARLIGIDRPGFGWSDSLPNRAILDWPSDVSELANAVAFPRVCVAHTREAFTPVICSLIVNVLL